MALISRSAFLKAAAATAAATLLAGCTTGSNNDASKTSGSSAKTGTYTVKHAFGETSFDSVPQRIAVVNYWKNPDVLLDLGVVPVGTPKVTYGGNANGSTDWFDAKLAELGGEKPTVYDETDGPDYEALAKLSPDAIFSVYTDMIQEVYDKLSKIAPVVAMPEGVAPYAATWEQVVEQAGAMLQREDAAKELISATQKTLEDAATQHSNLAGKTFAAGVFSLEEQTFSAYTASDSRSQFLSALGMKISPYITEHTKDDSGFFIAVSGEVVGDVQADVVWAWGTAESDAAAIKANTLFSQMPAVTKGGLVVETDTAVSMAVSALSPLSLTWIINKTETLQKLSEAADGKAS